MTNQRPWGTYTVLHDPDDCKVKRISVLPGQQLSYQYHHHRSEVWVFLSGIGKVILDGHEIDVSPGKIVQIPALSKHRIRNTGNKNLDLIEVQLGAYFGEDDIVRLEDDYDRVQT